MDSQICSYVEKYDISGLITESLFTNFAPWILWTRLKNQFVNIKGRELGKKLFPY